MAKAKNDQVKVRILPGRGIGGYGDAGAVVTMSAAEAEQYFKDGYVEYVDADAEQAVVSSTAVEPDPRPEPTEPDPGIVMKPETRRSRGKGKK